VLRAFISACTSQDENNVSKTLNKTWSNVKGLAGVVTGSSYQDQHDAHHEQAERGLTVRRAWAAAAIEAASGAVTARSDDVSRSVYSVTCCKVFSTLAMSTSLS